MGIMTEAEANKKWCPMSRNLSMNLKVAVNSYQESLNGETMCIASDCMMWRQNHDPDSLHGYCGLAGKL